MVIFEKSVLARCAHSQQCSEVNTTFDLPTALVRKVPPLLPALSELEVVRHYTQLSKKNYCIDTQFYPLGSCTMKYNPRGGLRAAMQVGFLEHHPLSETQDSQGLLECLYELQTYLKIITGMAGVCLTPMAGAQGECAGVMMIRAYHHARKAYQRNEILVPKAAHGTNPASAVLCGFVVKEVPTNAQGDIEPAVLAPLLGPKTAGIMLTNPSTLGVFERNIIEVAQLVHEAGGLLYYDGANLNAILGRVRPGDMGFDVMHMNMHKTFATPHGGGGPGSGPIAVSERLLPYLPIPTVVKRRTQEGEYYDWATREDSPSSIGRLSAFMGNTGVLLQAYFYIRLLGYTGLKRVAQFATLNANYLMRKLEEAGFTLAFPQRKATHEFIVTLAQDQKAYRVNAMDVAKRLLDFGFYAPTVYFPVLVPECLLIEPTETESKQELDSFINAMIAIRKEMQVSPEHVQQAPHHLPCRRLNELKAARELELVWKPKYVRACPEVALPQENT